MTKTHTHTKKKKSRGFPLLSVYCDLNNLFTFPFVRITNGGSCAGKKGAKPNNEYELELELELFSNNCQKKKKYGRQQWPKSSAHSHTF